MQESIDTLKNKSNSTFLKSFTFYKIFIWLIFPQISFRCQKCTFLSFLNCPPCELMVLFYSLSIKTFPFLSTCFDMWAGHLSLFLALVQYKYSTFTLHFCTHLSFYSSNLGRCGIFLLWILLVFVLSVIPLKWSCICLENIYISTLQGFRFVCTWINKKSTFVNGDIIPEFLVDLKIVNTNITWRLRASVFFLFLFLMQFEKINAFLMYCLYWLI